MAPTDKARPPVSARSPEAGAKGSHTAAGSAGGSAATITATNNATDTSTTMAAPNADASTVASSAAGTGGKLLPANAYTPLAPGEEFIPVVPAGSTIPEVTMRSVAWGLSMAVLFSFAAAYLGLKAGQVFEAAIPIAILAVFTGKLYRRKNTILENVIIQSIGSSSGVVVAGTIFTIPALYILDLDPSFIWTFFAASLGGFLGILFLIPLRRYFCKEEHGNLPFPEATATTEILATGESSGTQGRVLLTAMAIGGIYDFMVETVAAWNQHLTSRGLLGGLGERLYEKARMVLKMDATAALFGLGYIIGLRYAAIIAAGSVLSFLVLVPLVYFFGGHLGTVLPPAVDGTLIRDMSESAIFSTYVQKIGIGAIATAGVLGIIKMAKIIVSSFSVGMRELFAGNRAGGDSRDAENSDSSKSLRTDTDLPIKKVMIFLGMALVAILIMFLLVADFSPSVAIIGLAAVIVLAFLFTPVAARAIAIVGTNPVSGMTLITLIISSILLVKAGATGTSGMIIALIIGCVVCTSLSMSGGFITDLKVGYWLGATPRQQQQWKFLGVVVSAASVCLAIILINKAYGFVIDGKPNPAVPAPQGNLMAVIISSLMGGEEIPYLLYSLGVLVALVLEMAGVPPLAFALGMYLPIQINTPVLVGGFVAWLVSRSSKDKAVADARKERGTLIASGLIAGGALMGILGALFRLDQLGTPARFLSIGSNWVRREALGRWVEAGHPAWFHGVGMWLSLVMFVALCAYVYYESKRAKA